MVAADETRTLHPGAGNLHFGFQSHRDRLRSLLAYGCLLPARLPKGPIQQDERIGRAVVTELELLLRFQLSAMIRSARSTCPNSTPHWWIK